MQIRKKRDILILVELKKNEGITNFRIADKARGNSGASVFNIQYRRQMDIEGMTDMGKTTKANKRQQGGTFVVRVDGRERGSWQGQVIWTESNRKQYFRSTLELLHLMEDAMRAGESAETEEKEETEEAEG